MRKVFFALLLSVLMLGAVSATAFAHGGGHGGHGGYAKTAPVYLPATYAVCTLEDCIEPGLHEHDGVYYRCHNYNAVYNHGCGNVWHR